MSTGERKKIEIDRQISRKNIKDADRLRDAHNHIDLLNILYKENNNSGVEFC